MLNKSEFANFYFYHKDVKEEIFIASDTEQLSTHSSLDSYVSDEVIRPI